MARTSTMLSVIFCPAGISTRATTTGRVAVTACSTTRDRASAPRKYMIESTAASVPSARAMRRILRSADRPMDVLACIAVLPEVRRRYGPQIHSDVIAV